MPLLDAFRLEDPSHQSATWHVPWWWAFASDRRYQKKPPKDRNTAIKQNNPSRLAKGMVRKETIYCSSTERPQRQASQLQPSMKSCMTTARPQTPLSKAPKVVHISDLVSKDFVQKHGDRRPCSKVKAQHDTPNGRMNEASHNLMGDYTDYLPTVHTGRLVGHCPIHGVHQDRPTARPEHDVPNSKIQPNDTGHIHGHHLVPNMPPPLPVTSSRSCMQPPVDDYRSTDQGRLICPTCMPRQPLEKGLMHRDGIETSSESSPSAYHRHFESCETSSRKMSDYVQKIDNMQRQNKPPHSLPPIRSMLCDQAQYEAIGYLNDICVTSLPIVQAQHDHCMQPSTNHERASTCCKKSEAVKIHDCNASSCFTLAPARNCDNYGLTKPQQHHLDQAYLARQSSLHRIAPESSSSVSPQLTPLSQYWDCDILAAHDLDHQHDVLPYDLCPLRYHQGHHQYDMSYVEPHLYPSTGYEEHVHLKPMEYETGIMHLSNL